MRHFFSSLHVIQLNKVEIKKPISTIFRFEYYKFMQKSHLKLSRFSCEQKINEHVMKILV